MHVHYYEWMDQLFLRHGITTVRDVGNNLGRILELRQQSRTRDAMRPRIFACGPLIDGPLPRHGTGISVSVSTEAEAREVARQLVARGVDCLKVYEQLTPGFVRAIADEAQRAGVPVTAHLRDTPAVLALEAGVKGLEHALGFSACDERAGAEVARLLVARNAYVVPTLVVLDPVGPRLPCLKRFVGRLKQLGGHVVAGSDTANLRPRPGVLLHRELELLVEAGLTSQEALMAATSTAAGLLGQRASLGTIEPGKTADLVILRGDPLTSIAETQSVDIVIRDGRVVWKR
jgi:imidazolonepropionase-like amidohydrolase